MNNEVWKPVIGYEDIYEVSNMGRVKSCERTVRSKHNSVRGVSERILKPCKTTYGYLEVRLYKNRVAKMHKVHRLVAKAFIPNDDLFADTINHIDEDKTNNRVENLEWMSRDDNIRYSTLGSKSSCAKPVRCIETGQVFGSQTEASRLLGLNRNAVVNSIRQGVRAGGYHWKYID